MSDSATIDIKGDNKPLQNVLAGTSSMMKSWAAGVTSVMGGIAGSLLVTKLVDWGKQFVNSADEADRSMKALEQTLISSGNTTGMTIAQMEDLGKEVQKLTKFDDDAARSVSTLFASMKNIRGDIFKDGMMAAADLATKLGVELPTAGKMMAKALQDPERGLALLRRANITFSDSQKELIKNFMETGKTAEAQRIILEQVNKTVGGQAAGAVEGFSGQWAQFSNRLADVGENIGHALMPAVLAVMPAIERFVKIVEIFIEPILSLLTMLADLTIQFWEWLVPIEALESGMTALIEWVTQLAITIAEFLEPVIIFVKNAVTAFASAIWDAGTAIVEGMMPYVDAIVDTLMEWAGVIWDYLKPALIWLAEMGIRSFTVFQTVIQNFGDSAMLVIEAFALSVVSSFNIIVHVLTEVIPTYLSWFLKNWRTIFRDVWEFTKTVLSNLATNIYGFFQAVAGWFKGEGFNWEPKGLTEGFKAITEELPKVKARIKGEIESSLETSVGDRSQRLVGAFAKNLEANQKMLNGMWKEANQEADANAREREKKAEQAKLDAEKKGKDPRLQPTEPGAEEAKEDKSKSNQGTIEDIMALNKRITQAAAGLNKEDKTERAIREQTAKQEAASAAEVAATDRNTDAVLAGNDAIGDIEMPMAGALADD